MSTNRTISSVGGGIVTPISISNGGTGQTSQTAAFDALAPTTTSGDISYHNGTDNVRLAKGSDGDVLTLASGLPSWVAPAAGGDWTTVIKTSDTARSSTSTLAADPDLTIAIAVNEKMSIEGKVYFDSAATPDFKFNVDGPSSPSYVCIYGSYFSGNDSNGNLATTFKYSTLGFTVISLGMGAAGVNAFLEFSLVIHNGANSGNVAFWWAQNVSDAANTTVRAGSYLRYKSL